MRFVRWFFLHGSHISKNLARGHLSAVRLAISTTVFYFQLGYQFLGAVQIAVYAGGIMVLFVFSILLTHKPDDTSGQIESHRRIAGVCASVLGGAALLFALFTMPVAASGCSLAEVLAA